MKEFSLNLIEKFFYSLVFIFAALGVFKILPAQFGGKYYFLNGYKLVNVSGIVFGILYQFLSCLYFKTI